MQLIRKKTNKDVLAVFGEYEADLRELRKRGRAWSNTYLLDDQKRLLAQACFGASGNAHVMGVEVLPTDDTKTRKKEEMPFPGWISAKIGGVRIWIPDTKTPHGRTVDASMPSIRGIAYRLNEQFNSLPEDSQTLAAVAEHVTFAPQGKTALTAEWDESVAESKEISDTLLSWDFQYIKD